MDKKWQKIQTEIRASKSNAYDSGCIQSLRHCLIISEFMMSYYDTSDSYFGHLILEIF